MYIIKNALRCIGRAKGRNILIGIIALVIAVSACLGLSIAKVIVNAHRGHIGVRCFDGLIEFRVDLPAAR